MNVSQLDKKALSEALKVEIDKESGILQDY